MYSPKELVRALDRILGEDWPVDEAPTESWLDTLPAYVATRLAVGGRLTVAANDPLSGGLPERNWFDSLKPDDKTACLREMLQTPIVVALADGPRESWRPIVGACATSEAPGVREACREWSMRSVKYDPTHFDRDFNSSHGFSVGTLIRLAVQGGFDSEPWKAKARANGWGGTDDAIEADLAGGALTLAALGDPAEYSARNLAKPAKRKTEHGEDMIMGEVSMFNSPSGVGKSTLIAGIAVSVASGRPLMGEHVHKPRRTLIINGEDATDVLQASVYAYKKHYQITDDSLAHLYLIGADKLKVSLTKIDHNTRQPQLSKNGLKELEHIIERFRPEVVFLDPFGTALTVGQNQAEIVYPVMLELKLLAAKHQLALVIVDHTRKPSGSEDKDSMDAVRGSGAKTDAVRVAKGLRMVAEDDARKLGAPFGVEHNIRRLVDQKANYSPLGDGRYYQIIGVPMDNAEPPEYPVEDWTPIMVPFVPQPGGRFIPDGALRAAAAQLARGKGGEAYAPFHQNRPLYFVSDIAAEISPHMAGLSGNRLEAAAKEVVNIGLDGGWIELIDIPTKQRRPRPGIRVVWSATPWPTEAPPVGSFVR